MLRTAVTSVSRFSRCISPRTLSSQSQAVVPTIDVSALRGGTDAEKLAVASQIGQACQEIGFFTIVNHGVSNEVVQACWDTTRDYFDLSEESKEIEMTEDYPFGYCGYGVEVLSAGKAHEDGKEVTIAPDLKESFSIGPYNPASGMPAQRWPVAPAAMADHWLQYYQSMEQLSSQLLTGFALALDLPEKWFEDKVDRHCSAMRALNYPAMVIGEEHVNSMRASAHTDYGALTILRQDASGLQVMTRWGEWADVPVVPDAFIINLGDLMSRWTNERWVSTMHQVQSPPVGTACERRQSIAYFHNINSDYMVRCIDTCVAAGEQPKYPPIMAQEHLMQKHLASVGGNHGKASS